MGEGGPERDQGLDDKSGALGKRVFVSSLWMLSIKFIQRGLGLVSTLILARLLVPADFGVVAIIAIVVQFFNTFSNVGSDQYLIQKQTLDDADLHTAFSINVVFKMVLWAILFALAPYVSGYFDRPDLTWPLRVAASALLISAFTSPGVSLLKRELRYRNLLFLSITQKLLSFSVVMVIAFTAPSFWALIAGDLVAAAAFAFGSWFVHPYRARVGLRQFREQAAFSQWIIYRSLFGFVRAQSDTFVVSRHFSIEAIGIFQVAKSLSAMPASDIVAPAIDPLLSAFSRVRDDPADLGFKLRTALLAVSIMILPVCGYMVAFGGTIVETFLGAKWSDAHTVFIAMAPLVFTLAMSRIFESICITLRMLPHLLAYNIASTVFLVVCLLMLVDSDLALFTFQRSMLGVLIVLAFLGYLSQRVPLRPGRLLMLTLPTWSGCALGFVLSRTFDPGDEVAAPWRLLVSAIVYFTCCALTWVVVRVGGLGNAREYESLQSAVFASAAPLVGRLSLLFARIARGARAGGASGR